MKTICPDLTDKELRYLTDDLIVREYNSKEIVFNRDYVHNEVGFVVKGLIRAYYINQSGEQKTAWFVDELSYVSDYPSFLNGSPSNYIFESLEPSVIVFLPKKTMNDGYQKSVKLERYGRIIAEEVLKYMQERIEGFLFKSATLRYQEFISANKNLLHRVSVGHIASYLGIERQSLTRIRKNLLNKKNT